MEKIKIVCRSCHTVNLVLRAKLEKNPGCGRCKKRLFNGKPVALTNTELQKYISQNEIPLLVDFWAPWCAPCLMMAPTLEQTSAIFEPHLRIAKVNTEEEPVLAGQYRIQTIPTMILFMNGREVARKSGVLDMTSLIRWIQEKTGIVYSG